MVFVDFCLSLDVGVSMSRGFVHTDLGFFLLFYL